MRYNILPIYLNLPKSKTRCVEHLNPLHYSTCMSFVLACNDNVIIPIYKVRLCCFRCRDRMDDRLNIFVLFRLVFL